MTSLAHNATAPSDAVVRLDDVHVSFGDQPALCGITFSVKPGEMFGLVGPDGAGKTTAVRLLLGLLSPTRGEARILGSDPIQSPGVVKQHVGYLSQRFTLYGDLTVEENIEFFGEIHRVPDRAARLETLLDFTLLKPYRRRRADQLSGGMQKKLALACTLIHRPKLILLDEPTTGVDPVSRREFWTLLHELIQGGLTVLLTTPYLDEAERCTRVALVRSGRTLVEDEPSRIRQRGAQNLVEVVCDDVRSARAVLEASSRVARVQLFGDRLHLTPRRAEDDLRDVGDILRAARINVHTQRVVMPSLEDVFIELVERDARRDGVPA
jgi:ABC-2 type transport system ATP-binding protein